MQHCIRLSLAYAPLPYEASSAVAKRLGRRLSLGLEESRVRRLCPLNSGSLSDNYNFFFIVLYYPNWACAIETVHRMLTHPTDSNYLDS